MRHAKNLEISIFTSGFHTHNYIRAYLLNYTQGGYGSCGDETVLDLLNNKVPVQKFAMYCLRFTPNTSSSTMACMLANLNSPMIIIEVVCKKSLHKYLMCS